MQVFIGRFQPLHVGHLQEIREALACGPLILVLGSAGSAPSPRNPFSFEERVEMIENALTKEERSAIQYVPISDYYNLEKWGEAVRSAVLARTGESIVLRGVGKDEATASYLNLFEGWCRISASALLGVDASRIRDFVFRNQLSEVCSLVPPSVVSHLKKWMATSGFEALRAEYRYYEGYAKQWASCPFPPIFVTADSVVVCQDQVLLIRRKFCPGKGLLALPGGFVDRNERVLDSAKRELEEEVCLDVATLEPSASRVFDAPNRSLRGRTISHCFRFDLCNFPKLFASDDAMSYQWVPAEKLDRLQDQFLEDHFVMIKEMLALCSYTK